MPKKGLVNNWLPQLLKDTDCVGKLSELSHLNSSRFIKVRTFTQFARMNTKFDDDLLATIGYDGF